MSAKTLLKFNSKGLDDADCAELGHFSGYLDISSSSTLRTTRSQGWASRHSLDHWEAARSSRSSSLSWTESDWRSGNDRAGGCDRRRRGAPARPTGGRRLRGRRCACVPSRCCRGPVSSSHSRPCGWRRPLAASPAAAPATQHHDRLSTRRSHAAPCAIRSGINVPRVRASAVRQNTAGK